MVASDTRKARATSAVVRPPTARRVSAICDDGDTAGWQHMKSKIRVSSESPVAPCGINLLLRQTPPRNGVLAASASLLAAQQVGEPAGDDCDQPALRVVRYPSLGHCVRREHGLLHGIFSNVEVTVAAYHSAESLRRQLAQQVLNLNLGHPGLVSSSSRQPTP